MRKSKSFFESDKQYIKKEKNVIAYKAFLRQD